MKKFFTRFALASLFSLVAANAASVVGYELYYNNNGVAPGSGNIDDFVLTGEPKDGYSVAGTFGFFMNGVPLQVGQEITGPLSLRFTDATITCSSSTFCLPTTLTFYGVLSLSDVINVPSATLGLEGISNSESVVDAFAYPYEGTIELSNVSTYGNFNESVTFETLPIINNSIIFSMGLTTSGAMADGAQIYLPDSLFLQANLDSAVPEPGTMAIVAAGLAGAFWFRRQRR